MTQLDNPARAIAFVDGQNLTNSIRTAFGIRRPSYDLKGLVNYICTTHGWTPVEIRFYTGLPSMEHAPDLHHYWARRLSQLGREGITTWKRRLSYSTKTHTCPNCGHTTETVVGREKGVDVRICLDAVSLMARGAIDVALFFTQDQDFFEAVQEIQRIATDSKRQVTIASAFPKGTGRNRGGIRGTEQIPFDLALYSQFKR